MQEEKANTTSTVFLGEPHPTNWQGIPTPKLGDFGLACMVTDTTIKIPGAGTKGFKAPVKFSLPLSSSHITNMEISLAGINPLHRPSQHG